jgi:hypothetical protein
MPGAYDPRYVAARSVLLDALGALGAQREAVVLVGAQAIYMYKRISKTCEVERRGHARKILIAQS